MVQTQWPLVGRERELAEVWAALGYAGSDRPAGGVVLLGGPGVGKTRILRSVVAGAGDRGWSPELVAATPATDPIPYGAVSHLLPADAKAVPGGAPAFTPRLSGSGGRPLLMAIDDAHLLNESSAGLVHQLAVQRLATVVLAVRADRPVPDALAALWKDGLVTLVEVGPLPDTAAAAADQVVADCATGLGMTDAGAVGGVGDGGASRAAAGAVRGMGDGGASRAAAGAVRGMGDGAASRAAGGAARAWMLLFDGHVREALVAASAVQGAPAGSPESRMWARAAAVTASAMLGATAHAVRLADEGLRLAYEQATEPVSSLAHLRVARGHALLMAGRLDAAREEAERGYQQALVTRDHGLTAQWAALRAVVAQVRGDLPVAVASLREITGYGEPGRLRRLHMIVLAGVLAMSGDVAAAERWLRCGEELGDPLPRAAQAQADINRGWVCAARGDLLGAIDHALRAAASARAAEQTTVEAFALHDVVRYGAARRVRGRLARLARCVDSDLVLAFADSAAAHAGGEPWRLERAAVAFEELDAPLLAAEAMAAAARAHRVGGDLRAATRAHERAGLLAAASPGARTPALSLDTPSAVLTPRERQIALLAARRLASLDIARRLRLSVRTVDNHLTRVYTKLGIANRAQLTAVLGTAVLAGSQDLGA